MRLSERKMGWPFILISFVSFQASLVIAHEASDSSQFSYGTVDFPISCDEDTQAHFNQGVAQLHNMMYIQAENIFNDAAESAPDCSMLFWGVAMANFHPLWGGLQNKAEFDRGTKAIQRALAQPAGTEKEQRFIEAASAFYSVDFTAKRNERINAWADQQSEIFQSYPDDHEAVAFYALSHLATASKSDKSLAHQKVAGKLMENLNNEAPSHPAGFHYQIHAYDNPVFASKAENVSRTYDSIAPEVPHSLHMPSHIFVRMGLWNETVFWNTRSAAAAVEQSDDKMTSQHYAHATDYLVYARLQQGDIEAAEKSLRELYAIDNHQDGFGVAYALTASPARIPLEQEDWSAAANLLVNAKENFSWDKFKFAEPKSHFARGIGAARSNNLELAEKSIKELQRLHGELQDFQNGYWATLAEANLYSVKAWKTLAEKNFTKALDLMVKAADIEDSVDKSPVTPGAVLPARELLGDMLQLLDQPSEALIAYETALRVSPGRARSLRGAAQAAESLGNMDKANEYKGYLQAILTSG